MVLPYAIPAVFGPVRRSDEPIGPLERYAMYPYAYEDAPRNRGKSNPKAATRIRPIGLLDLRASLPQAAKDALKTAADHAAAWLTQANSLKESLSSLARRDSLLFEQRIVTAFDDTAGRAEDGADIGDIRVRVIAIARPQRNLGFGLTPNAPSVIPPGTHLFRIVSRSVESVALPAAIRQGDTNGAALGRLRDAINEANLGMTAALRYADRSEIVRLELIAGDSGTDNAFSITDIGGGSVVSASGIGQLEQPASNSIYTIDGGPYAVSSSTEIPVRDGKVMIALDRLPLAVDITVRVSPDLSALADKVDLVAKEMNALHAIYLSAAGSLNPALRQRLNDTLTHPGAKAVGLAVAHGVWKLDREQLHAAAMEGNLQGLKQALAGRRGFASALSDELNRLTSSPTNDLINVKAGAFQAFTRYGASSEPYLQLRFNGFHVDSVL
ncbi:hypothetical protein [Paenibacillus glycinis]|uniref:Flagellar hook-associated protein 2 C-terminal domain-containing protein n=1 Tax=Paenibacillus glycinis TaxID=2697035 RepID=A0ABW9XYC6_9BACL|nr:hypothetical protein [Paenibacillus glycinis]NBD27718.1 hypothetical protein [Paenibacillus glycinis]